jgi:hypothetical protein
MECLEIELDVLLVRDLMITGNLHCSNVSDHVLEAYINHHHLYVAYVLRPVRPVIDQRQTAQAATS